jgi:hypothetical protein
MKKSLPNWCALYTWAFKMILPASASLLHLLEFSSIVPVVFMDIQTVTIPQFQYEGVYVWDYRPYKDVQRPLALRKQ